MKEMCFFPFVWEGLRFLLERKYFEMLTYFVNSLGMRDKIMLFFGGLLFFSPKSKCILLYTSVRHFLKYVFKFKYSPRELKISAFGNVFVFKEFTGEIGMFPQIFIDHIYDSDGFTALGKGEKVLFDVGANIGLFSIKMAKQYPQARIYSFEPNPDVFGRLVRNIEINGVQNIFAYNVGMSDAKETAFIDARHSTVLGKITKTRESALSEVQLSTICSFMEQNKIGQIDLLKIDVEGYEYKVVEGLEVNARHISKIVMECDPSLEEDITDFLDLKGLKKIKRLPKFNVIYFSR